MNSKPCAHIENWYKLDFENGYSYLIGTITKHPYQNHFNTTYQQTSRLLHFDPVLRVAETENTHYTLGKESKNEN